MKFQQGDVIIKTVDKIPQGKKLNHLILAEGKVSGHSHRVINGQAELLLCNQVLYLRILTKEAEIEHEEHGNIIIPRGDYVVTQVQEWDYDEEEAKQIQD